VLAGMVACGILGVSLVVALLEHLGSARRRAMRRHGSTVGLCVAFMGFTLLGLEVLLLLGFQALYGYVYQQLAILVALFMVGMAGGAWLSLRNGKPPGSSFPRKRESAWQANAEPRLRRDDAGGDLRISEAGLQAPSEFFRLGLVQLVAALAPLLLVLFFVLLGRVRNVAGLLTLSPLIFPVLALIAGLMGGYQFPLASRLYFGEGENSNRNPGVLYALDLLGACVGAVALSAYLLPVYGFLRTAMLMAVVNFAPAALAVLAAFEQKVRREPS
jgi:spermidine synthase